MRSLLGDSFLRRFAGHLNHRLKHLSSKDNEQNPKSKVDQAVEPDRLTVGEALKEGEADGKVISQNEVFSKQDEIEP